MASKNKLKKAKNAYCVSSLKSGLRRMKGIYFYDASQRKKNKKIDEKDN